MCSKPVSHLSNISNAKLNQWCIEAIFELTAEPDCVKQFPVDRQRPLKKK